MSNYETNVYYNPEKHGPIPVAEYEYSDRNYVFDTRVIWRHQASGALYMARDSGCSCPTPFEDYNGIDDLERFSPEVIESEFREESAPKYPGHSPEVSPQQAGEWLDALRTILQTPYHNSDY